MKKFGIYYVVHIILNVLLLIGFSSNINIHFLSVVPLFVIALMAIQAKLFVADNNSIESTAFSAGDTVRLTNAEQNTMYVYLKQSFLILLPFEFPFVFFLPSYAKLLSLILYAFAYILGGIIFKIKFGKAIQDRIKSEKKELQDQKEQEELGQK